MMLSVKQPPSFQKVGMRVGLLSEVYNMYTIPNPPFIRDKPDIFKPNLVKMEAFQKATHNVCLKLMELLAILMQVSPGHGGKDYFTKRHDFYEVRCSYIPLFRHIYSLGPGSKPADDSTRNPGLC